MRIHKMNMLESERVKDGVSRFRSRVDTLRDNEARTLRDYDQHGSKPGKRSNGWGCGDRSHKLRTIDAAETV